MSKHTSAPLVDLTGLHLPDRDEAILIGSPEWLEWLAEAKSFRFECPSSVCIEGTDFVKVETASFTALPTGKGKLYWNARRKVDGTIRQETLGKAEKLTYDLMKQVACNISDERYWDKRRKQRSSGADKQGNEQGCKLDDYNTAAQSSSQAGEEIVNLKAENEALKGRISYLLDERGLIQAKATRDAKVRIEQLEKQVTELDNANWEIQKQYTTVDDLAQRRLKQLHELQSQLDSLRQVLKSAKQYKLHGRQVIRVEDFEKFLSCSSLP